MPWTAAQNKLFRAAAHNPAIAKSSGIPQATASKMAHEGISKPKALAKAIKMKK
jgi:hypothetical protein